MTKHAKEPVEEAAKKVRLSKTDDLLYVKDALHPGTVWICPDCDERNEKDVCQLCGRVRRGDEKTEKRCPSPGNADVTGPEKMPSVGELKAPEADAASEKDDNLSRHRWNGL